MILRVATLNYFKNQIKLLWQLKGLGRYVQNTKSTKARTYI